MTFVDLFLAQVRRTPEAAAVRDDRGCLTYAELEQRSAALAARLKSEGLGRGEAAGVLLPRTSDIVVAAVAVLRAGGVYMPIDPSYPEQRREYMLKDSGAKVLVTDICAPAGARTPDESPDPDSPAYLLYTSGTTGNPKGVLHSHRSLLALCTQDSDGPLVSTGVFSGFTFIASVHMMLPPLVGGGSCAIVPDAVKSDLDLLDRFIRDLGISQIFLPASLAASMVEEYALDGVTVYSAGEKLRNFKPKGSSRVVNIYGSTEGVVVLASEVKGDEIDIPLGRPCPGVTVRVVDENMNDVPDGTPGELLYSADIMAQSYLNLPEQTAAKWFTAAGARWYRTSDRVVRNPDGAFLYLGRADNMVKIRGFRVETGEVENRIRVAAPQILDAVVVLRSVHGIDHLCCYYTASDALDAEAVKTEIARHLAGYMVPDVWVRLEEFPRNANGKIVRASLPDPAPQLQSLSVLYSEVEMRVEEAARTVLGLDAPLDIDDSFLSQGGDSLRAMKLSALLREQGIRISGADILRLKVLREIASHSQVAYERLWTAEQYSRVRARFASWGESVQKVLPLTPQQDDLLYSEIFYPDSCGTRSIYVMDIDSDPSEAEIAAAVASVSRSREQLRAAPVYRGVSVFQQVITDRVLPSEVVDLTGSADSAAEFTALCESLRNTPTDPERTPALHTLLVRLPEGNCLVFKALHASLGLEGVRGGIAAILRELAPAHPDDKALAAWIDLLPDPDEGAPEAACSLKSASSCAASSYNEIAVYSDRPGLKNFTLVHTGNSGSDAYYALADRISQKCSLSVIEPYNLYNSAAPLDGIKAIAAKYVEILKRHQPQGPYILGGWCYGGVVAHEMACLLEAAGETVEHLVMLDSHALTDPEAGRLFASMASFSKREYFETSPLFADLRNQGLLESVVENSRRVSRNLSEHVPSVFHGPVLYFKPQVTPAGLSGDNLSYWQEMMKYSAGGFERYCTDIRVVPTPHEHDLMLDRESLDIIVPELEKIII